MQKLSKDLRLDKITPHHKLSSAHPLPKQLVAAARLAAASTKADIAALAAAAAGAGSGGRQTSKLSRVSRAVAAVATAAISEPLAAAAEQILRPTLQQARLYQVALDRVDAALAKEDASPSAFVRHARSYLRCVLRILDAAAAAAERGQ